MKIWVAGIPGGWSSDRMVAALKKLKVDCQLFSVSDCTFDLNSGVVSWQGNDLSKLDGLVVRKMGDPTDPLTPFRVNILYQLAAKGVRIFSPPKFIDDVNDRYKMTRLLSNGKIPMPETIVTESLETACEMIDRWGKAVLKPVFTSKGRAMLLLDCDKPHRLDLKHWQRKVLSPFYLQRYVPTSYDIGVAVMGKQVLGAFRRIASGESWQTTIRTGGHYECFNPDSKVLDIVDKITDLMEFDYTVIDLVPNRQDYLVYEVSAFGGFSGLWKCGIDAPSIFAKYVLTVLAVPPRKSARVR
jgi:ribosomal protein S6--L-glutamate ligase